MSPHAADSIQKLSADPGAWMEPLSGAANPGPGQTEKPLPWSPPRHWSFQGYPTVKHEHVPLFFKEACII